MSSLNFFEHPILNSPYLEPTQHHELIDGQPTNSVLHSRRSCDLITPIPKVKKRKPKKAAAQQMGLDMSNQSVLDGNVDSVNYELTEFVNGIRRAVSAWRALPNPRDWQVSPTTQRLLSYWRTHDFQGIRPFFCQLEAVETLIWLTEVASKTVGGKRVLAQLQLANREANPELFRIAMKLATGAGKTTVMAMIIAWQTLNAVRSPGSDKYSRGFLLIAPGITIRDRLNVLRPEDNDNYYDTRELVPIDMIPDMGKAIVKVANYHAFKLRETLEISKGTRRVVEGRDGKMQTLETEGEMVRRVASDLMGVGPVIVINDEAHHCYRERPESQEVEALKGDDLKQAKEDAEAARLWINGIEAFNRVLAKDRKRKGGVIATYDLSATPFFLRGSGYVEGTLFPWVVSDFSLMDAIECGIVKLPRMPVADNTVTEDMPKFRNLWDNIKADAFPRRGAKQTTPAWTPRHCQRFSKPRCKTCIHTTNKPTICGWTRAVTSRLALSSFATTRRPASWCTIMSAGTSALTRMASEPALKSVTFHCSEISTKPRAIETRSPARC